MWIGGNALFAPTATGFGSLSGQWEFNGSNLAGGTASDLALNNVPTTNAGSGRAGPARALPVHGPGGDE